MLKRIVKFTAGTLAILFFVIAVYVSMTWASDKPVSELQSKWAPTPSVFIEVMGMQAHVRDEGPREDRNPIVLIHGTASSLHTWDGWVRELKSSRRVIRFDLPGFGLTGPSPDNRYSLDLYSKFVISLLHKLEVKRSVIVGNSLGGSIAWYTALLHPIRFEKLILVDSSGYNYQSTSVPLAFRIAKIPILRNIANNVLPRSIVASSVKNTYGNPSKVTEEQIDRYYDLALREGNRKALTERFKQMPMGEMENRIHELNIPTLILWGNLDRLIPPSNAERFHKDIAKSKLVIFNELGHIPQEEDPLNTVKAVKEFIR
ncbi:alpha/beta hydrolase family protein [Leptospira broomii serovar Hurstbridge str. 5399]|uniref:Alpha/beta hydrolase family protein n=1 Tax=Leptospira broomii serovar Hurstbridge str. 5399 TaxID=1049789 RepID=T0G9C9_9LEPT|nr:alpha/beta hydrolase [Leptospira broomii]EQA43439.1 alpha/beta hydrolase family protein [Leptospira broomii serovar Hurstbridge str. 5399]